MPKPLPASLLHAPCPCSVRENEPLSYAECCQVWHQGLKIGQLAPTAQALMRSRYSAYALAKRNDEFGHDMLHYLLGTWHSATTPGELELSPIQWTGLEVLRADEGSEAAVVEFVAWFKENGKATKMHELSRFVRVNGAWKYIDGDVD